MLPHVVSVNVGSAQPTEHSDVDRTGIDKRPVSGPVRITVPGPGGSGLAGDVLCDVRFHGGGAQAVYAFAREDLDEWAATLGRVLADGVFGENLTTSGLDVTGAIVGERVVEEGHVQAGDEVAVLDRPGHGVTLGESFRALTTERELLPRLLVVESLAATARKRLGAPDE